jgi:hypothetical protein
VSIEAIKTVVDLIEMGAMANQEDIVKCLRSAIEQAEKQEPTPAMIQALTEQYDSDRAIGIGFNPQTLCRAVLAVQRQPLTDEEIWREYQALWPFHPQEEPRLAADMATFARAIERKHGIGGGE